MSNSRRHFQALAVSFLLASTPLAGAHAQAAEEALDRLQAIFGQQGVKIEWERADITGDDARLVGVGVGNDDAMLPVGDIALNGISRAQEGYRVEEFLLDSFHYGDDAGAFSAEGVEVTGILLPDDEHLDRYGGTIFYERSVMDSFRVNVEGRDVFTLTGTVVEMSLPENGEPMELTGGAEGFHLDLSIVQDPDQLAVIRALGYEQIEGSVALTGYWQPEDGRLALTRYDFIVNEAGTLGITVDLSGYTPDFIASLRELQQRIAANPDGDSSAQGLAMLGLLQQLSLHGAEVVFTDDSLTGKVLEFVAGSQGMRPADIANQARAVLPFALGQLGNPELTMQATQAVSAYLDDPRTLRITAVPAAPVPFALIMAGAMASPAELTRTLGVRVTAND